MLVEKSSCSFKVHKGESLRKVIQIFLRDRVQRTRGDVLSCSKASSHVFKGRSITGQLV